MEHKQNCWEYRKCGREPGGTAAGDSSVCPAAADSSCDGMNAGKSAGRVCWSVSGTFCSGRDDGSASEKQLTCFECGFYRKAKHLVEVDVRQEPVTD